jgi:hypothetical protein
VVGQFLEERVIYAERFQARTLDFRGRLAFARYDECAFVKCKVLIDDQTENLAITNCTFEDCNIDELQAAPDRAVVVDGNVFKAPIEIRNADLDRRLAEALSAKL